MEYLLLRESEPPIVAGRTIEARIATIGRVYDPGGGQRERLLPGAFKSPLARPGGLVRYRHEGEKPGDVDDPQLVYGAVRALREDGDAIIAVCELSDSPRCDHLLSLVRSRTITGVSMSATVAESRPTTTGIRDIVRISQLHGVSLTPTPANPDAEVLALRERRAATHAAALAEVLALRERRAATHAAALAERAYWASLRAVR